MTYMPPIRCQLQNTSLVIKKIPQNTYFSDNLSKVNNIFYKFSPRFGVLQEVILSEEFLSDNQLLIHEADHRRPVLITIFTQSVRPSVSQSQNFKIKRQSLPAGTVGWPSGSLMTPVLYLLCFAHQNYVIFVI